MIAGNEPVRRPEAGDRAIRISVVYALPEQQVQVALEVPAGTNVGEAVARCGLLQRFPQIAAQPLACAIYSRPVALGELLSEGDRIEILRPLQIDPKEARRRAAAQARPRRSAPHKH